MKPKRVILTGANGFIGRHLLDRLMPDVATELVVVGRQRPHVLEDRGVFIEADLNHVDTQRLMNVCGGGIDTVFHLAAGMPKSQGEGNEYESMLAGNVDATWRLLQVVGPITRHVVFTSTVDVYRPGTSSDVITELTSIEPMTIYAATKACAEHLVKIEAQRSAFTWTILRLGHIYGPGEEVYVKLIPQSIRALLAGQNPKVCGTGKVLRDFLYVSDAVEAIIRASSCPAAVGRTINIVSGRSVTLRETLEQLIQVSGRAASIEVQANRPDGVSYRFDNGLMRELLGEWSLVSLKDGLEQEYRCQEANASK